MQADIHIDSMQGDAIDERGFVQGSAQGSVRADTHVDSTKGDAIHGRGSGQGSVQGDTMQADIHIDSMQ
eukprot:15442017-Alexandrium_andersonii.AAC.1